MLTLQQTFAKCCAPTSLIFYSHE